MHLKVILGLVSAIAGAAAGAAPTAPTWYPVSYGTEDKSQSALFLPASGESKGLLVWVHGGGWAGGSADSERNLLGSFAAQGISVLSLNYRLKAAGVFPAPILDVKAAVDAASNGFCTDCSNPEMWQVIKKGARKGIMLTGGEVGGYLATYAAGELLTYRTEPILRCAGGIGAPLDFRNAAMFPLRSKQQISRFSGDNLSELQLTEMSPAAKVQAQQWMGLEKIKWYFNFSSQDEAYPAEFSKWLPNYLGANGVQVYLSENAPELTAKGTVKSAISANLLKATLTAQVKNCFAL